MTSWRQTVALVVLAALTAGTAALLRVPSVRIPMGGYPDYALSGDWQRSKPVRVESGPADERTAFYYRPLPASVAVHVPLRAVAGDIGLVLRASANIRARVDAFVAEQRVASAILPPGGRWTETRLDLPASALDGDLRAMLGVRLEPLTRGGHLETPQLLLDFVRLDAGAGLRFGPAAIALLGLVPLAVALFLVVVGAGRWALPVAAVAAAVALVLAARAPLPVLAAIPRLVLPALAAGALVASLMRRVPEAGRADRAGLAALVAAGAVLHGGLAFFPEHCPEDRDTHAVRARDLSTVEPDYGSLMRYGSHLMTPNQVWPNAIDHFGSDALYPYAPTSYVAYFLLHRAGLDLIWALTVFNALFVMAAAPWLWLVAARAWGRDAAWLAALLFTLDLALWHHVGRARGPAVFGAALLAVALGHLVLWSLRGGRRGGIVAAALLGLAALGYTGAAFLLGLFGVALIAIVAVDARALGGAMRRGLVLALAGGGLVAGGLYYFHYVPGLLASAARGSALPELFPGREVYRVFRNESRMMMRVWAQGYGAVLIAGLVAAPVALRRAPPAARPVLGAWLAAWALTVALKDPALFPRLLRYVKEDLLLAPLLCLFVGAAVAAVPDPRWRAALAAIVLAAAAWMQAADLALHSATLRL